MTKDPQVQQVFVFILCNSCFNHVRSPMEKPNLIPTALPCSVPALPNNPAKLIPCQDLKGVTFDEFREQADPNGARHVFDLASTRCRSRVGGRSKLGGKGRLSPHVQKIRGASGLSRHPAAPNGR